MAERLARSDAGAHSSMALAAFGLALLLSTGCGAELFYYAGKGTVMLVEKAGAAAARGHRQQDRTELLKRAEAGDASAQLALALHERDDKRYEEARRWFESADRGGSLEARLIVAQAQISGDLGPFGMAYDPAAAALRLSSILDAQATHDTRNAALELLGNLHEKGDGVAQDLPRASALHLEAARAGSRSAAMRSSAHYQLGEGVARDAIEAYAWAMAAGVQRGPLRALGAGLAPAELERARQLGRERAARMDRSD